MSLESAIQNLADELKRYNDSNVLSTLQTALSKPSMQATEVASVAAEKAEITKPEPKAEKPKAAPKAEAKAPTFAEVQTQAVAFVAARNRDELITILKDCGVQPEEVNGKQAYKISSAKDDPKVLAKIAAAFKQALAA